MSFVDMYLQDVQQLSIPGTVVSNDYVVTTKLCRTVGPYRWGQGQCGPKRPYEILGYASHENKETMPSNAVADLNMALAHPLTWLLEKV